MVHHRHPLVFCWLVVCQAIDQDKATITGVARLAPRHLAEWQLRRLLTAAYGPWRTLLWWLADHVIATRPPPADGVCSLVVDRTRTDQTGPKPPLAKTGRLHEASPDSFGLPIVGVILPWGHDRIPGDGERVRRTEHSRYRWENRLLRWMLGRFRRPSWAEMVGILAAAALASNAHLQRIQPRGDFLGMALARTWCCANGHTWKDLVTHVPTH
jgi:hypothetical protein